MQLSLFSDYSLRTLLYLGAKGGGDLVESAWTEVGDIAAAYGISRNHLVKVAHRLGQLGYVETRRGRGGGIRLAHAPEAVRLGEVVRDTEPSAPLVECFDSASDGCRLSPVCRLKGVLGEADRAFFATLDRYTLADLLEPMAAVRQQLGIKAKLIPSV